MNVAIIPARGGSKRVPKKNVRPFCGVPIIGYSIQAALESNTISEVYVSTDDREIERIALDYGAKSLGLRCPELSDDYSSTTEVIRYEIGRLHAKGVDFDYVAELYATAAMLRPEVIDGIHAELVGREDAVFAFSAVEFGYPVQRGFYVDNGRCVPVDSEAFDQRSQDLRAVFHDAGQVYWASSESWTNEQIRFNHRALPVPVPRNTVCDIDTNEDWFIAEAMYRALHRVSS